MTNKIISYTNLSSELKTAFSTWLRINAPELVSFPFKGKHMKGYIFSHERQQYLVVVKAHQDDILNATLDVPEINNINEEF